MNPQILPPQWIIMTNTITIEVIGLRDSYCSPFTCADERSCGLSDCYPVGTLVRAFEVLEKYLRQEYGDAVSLVLTLIDDNVPPHIEKIISENYPPIPIILVNGKITPIGRISLPLIKKEIEKCQV
jgi:hypothetical protein